MLHRDLTSVAIGRHFEFRRFAWSGSQVVCRCRNKLIKMIQWIQETLPETRDLSREQLFAKVAATAEDVTLVLNTLWTQADVICCDADKRLAFHTMVLLGAIGG